MHQCIHLQVQNPNARDVHYMWRKPLHGSIHTWEESTIIDSSDNNEQAKENIEINGDILMFQTAIPRTWDILSQSGQNDLWPLSHSTMVPVTAEVFLDAWWDNLWGHSKPANSQLVTKCKIKTRNRNISMAIDHLIQSS